MVCAYKENPMTVFTFTNKNSSTTTEQGFSNYTGTYTDKESKASYLGFTPTGADEFYVKDTENDVKKINLLEWGTHFNKKIATGNTDDILCDK